MFPLFTTRCPHVRHDVRDLSGGSVGENVSDRYGELISTLPEKTSQVKLGGVPVKRLYPILVYCWHTSGDLAINRLCPVPL